LISLRKSVTVTAKKSVTVTITRAGLSKKVVSILCVESEGRQKRRNKNEREQACRKRRCGGAMALSSSRRHRHVNPASF
jgi:hypothetical protein